MIITKINQNKRYRRLKIVSYLSFDKCVEICLHYPNCLHYAIILHDKDVTDNGNAKQVHCHILMILKDARNPTAIANLFTDEVNNAGNVALLPIDNLVQDFLYLNHSNAPEKYQYSADSIFTDDVSYFTNHVDTDKDNTLQIIDDIINGKSLRYMVATYGRDFVIHYSQYKAMAIDVKFEDLQQVSKSTTDRSIEKLPISDDQMPF